MCVCEKECVCVRVFVSVFVWEKECVWESLFVCESLCVCVFLMWLSVFCNFHVTSLSLRWTMSSLSKLLSPAALVPFLDSLPPLQTMARLVNSNINPICASSFRGCLFYGPPGTGKTLVARALANECSQGDRKVSFFMRKGADCLSKWVGESERQLRLLFDQVNQAARPRAVHCQQGSWKTWKSHDSLKWL